MEELTDVELVEQAQSALPGDTRAFSELMRRHLGRVRANCRAITRAPGDVEDLAQDVFVKAYFALGRFEHRAQFGTWVNRIKVNHCLNFLQKQRGKRFVDIDDTPIAGREATDRPLEQQQMRTHIEQTLDALPDSLRIPLIMCDMDNLPYQDIADALGIGLSAVKMRIKRGRERFRELYGEGPGR
ncbi:MAG: RNA polymerase sigma factor [Myxococcales bacterium]|nr:RNA polymerase sigma factor [Myxococcales bacterium]